MSAIGGWLSLQVTAQVAKLDSSFNSNGIVITDFRTSDNRTFAGVLQPDSKIVVAGYTNTGPGRDFAMARYLPDGTLDSSFNFTGLVSMPFRAAAGAEAIALQPDGKIVIAGYANNPAGGSDFAVARYHPDGSLDMTFGTNGVTTINVGVSGDARALAIQPDGKIVVAGRSVLGLIDSFTLARFHSDGAVDLGFGTNGMVITDFMDLMASSFDSLIAQIAYSVQVQPDGRITVAGAVYLCDKRGWMALARYHSDGTLDNSFGTSGRMLVDFGLVADARAMIIRPDGKILAGGFGDVTACPPTCVPDSCVVNFNFALARIDSSGQFDSSFGTAGLVLQDFWGGFDAAYGMALQQDGKIVLAGWATYLLDLDFAMARFNSDGTPDSTFGQDGKLLTPIGTENDLAMDLLVQPDGKIVAIGYAQVTSEDADFALVRYHPDGSLDIGFGDSGIVVTDFRISDVANAVVIQPNNRVIAAGFSGDEFALARYTTGGAHDNSFGSGTGKVTNSIEVSDAAHVVLYMPDGDILLAGESFDGSKKSFALIRYNTNSSLDVTFGTGGKQTTFLGFEAVAYAAALQSDGKIVLAGFANNGGDDDFALARYNSNGNLDNTFGNGGKVITAIGAGDAVARTVVIQPDGKIVAAGWARGGFAAARYHPNGTLDNTFNGSGSVITPVGSNPAGYASALQTDGRILLAGTADDRITVIRYTTTGSLDNSFGSGGIVTTPIGVRSGARAITLQPNGKILVAGFANNGADDDFAVVRYNTDGTLDTTFSPGGVVVTPIGPYDDVAHAIAITGDKKIVAAGYSFNGTDDDFATVRYLPGLDIGVIDFTEPLDELTSRSPLIYPNPIRDHALLEYTLLNDERITIELCDLEGRLVTTFVENKFQQAGRHQQSIYLADELPSGMYVIAISSAKGDVSIRVVK